MIVKSILIIVAVSSNANGISVTKMNYGTEKACQVAAKHINEHDMRIYAQIDAWCIHNGDIVE